MAHQDWLPSPLRCNFHRRRSSSRRCHTSPTSSRSRKRSSPSCSSSVRRHRPPSLAYLRPICVQRRLVTRCVKGEVGTATRPSDARRRRARSLATRRSRDHRELDDEVRDARPALAGARDDLVTKKRRARIASPYPLGVTMVAGRRGESGTDAQMRVRPGPELVLRLSTIYHGYLIVVTRGAPLLNAPSILVFELALRLCCFTSLHVAVTFVVKKCDILMRHWHLHYCRCTAFLHYV